MYQESYDTLQQVAGGLKALAIVFQELEEAGKALSHLADLVEQVIEAETENEDTDENGGETRTERLNADVETVFGLNQEGKLVITGAGDEQLEGKTFEKIEAPAE